MQYIRRFYKEILIILHELRTRQDGIPMPIKKQNSELMSNLDAQLHRESLIASNMKDDFFRVRKVTRILEGEQ